MDQLPFPYRCHSTGSYENQSSAPPPVVVSTPTSLEIDNPVARSPFTSPDLLCRPLDVPMPLSYSHQGRQTCTAVIPPAPAYQASPALRGISPTASGDRNVLCSSDPFYGNPTGCLEAKDALDAWRMMPYAPLYYYPYDVPGYGFTTSYGMDLNGVRRKNATRETTSTLKAWLNEHRKNPYPTKGEKIMLAIITKMTLTQVSTWFANARRRLKKENKMTWEPRNLCDDDCDESSDADDDERIAKSKKTEANTMITRGISDVVTSTRGSDKSADMKVTMIDNETEKTKPRIWSIVDTATSHRKDRDRKSTHSASETTRCGLTSSSMSRDDRSYNSRQDPKSAWFLSPSAMAESSGYGMSSLSKMPYIRPSASVAHQAAADQRSSLNSSDMNRGSRITSKDTDFLSGAETKSFNLISQHQKNNFPETPRENKPKSGNESGM